MQKKISIISSEFSNNHFSLTTNVSIQTLQPTGQILVDSDHFSFIYIMEDNEDYTYIILPEQLWPSLKLAYEQSNPVFVKYGNEQIELTNFHEELEFLITNIKGNSNYGEDMVTKVERYFKEI
jgi:hypothetical protein